jgi:archaellum biogenesis protein FlaJ (TadC family)
MFDVLTSITWRSALIGAAIFVVTFLISLALVSVILVKLPADHFKRDHETKFWSGPRPALRAAGMIGKNVIGVLLVIVGIVLSIPGVPGQGLLTILLGIMLVDFPGKRRLEQKLLAREEVRKTIDRLRARFNKPPLELDT